MEESAPSLFLQELYREARRNTGWIKFMGILLVIVGIPAVLVLVGFLVIWMGMILIQAANAIEQQGVNGLEEFAAKIGLYFRIYGIMSIVGLLLYVVFFALFFSGVIPGLENPGIFT